MDGWMDGYWLPPTEPTVCIKDCICKVSVQTQVTSGHPLRLSLSFEIKLYSIRSISPERRKTCMVHWITNKQTKKKLIALLTRRVFQRSSHLSPSLCQEQFLKHTICHTKQPTYAYIQISLSRRKGGVSLVYPTSSRIWPREWKNPSSAWLLPLQPTAWPPSQVSGKCIRSNSMINNKINSLLQAKGVEIQRGNLVISPEAISTLIIVRLTALMDFSMEDNGTEVKAFD